MIEDQKADIRLILDFIERWNKQDKESNVSEAAQRLEVYLEECKTEQKLKNILHITEQPDGPWLISWLRPDFQGGESAEISESDARDFLHFINRPSQW